MRRSCPHSVPGDRCEKLTPQLYDESHMPFVNHELRYEERSPYGDLPHVWYSKHIRSMLNIPAGISELHQAEAEAPMLEPIPEGP